MPTAAGPSKPGIWRDHPDHVYECRTEKQAGLKPCDRIGGSEDASHTHRFPLWMRSLIEAAPAGSPEQAYYTACSGGWSGSFSTGCWSSPRRSSPAIGCVTTWTAERAVSLGYKQFGPDQGYGPYELSFAC
jgi:hypothetical protein